MTAACHLADLAEALGLAEELAAELARRGMLAGDVHEGLRQVVREELARAGRERGSEELLTVARAAKHANVAPATIREWISRGLLGASRAGRQWRIRREDMEACMRQQAAGPARVDLEAMAGKLVALDRARRK